MSKPSKGKSSKKILAPESVLRQQAELKQLKSQDPTNLKEQISTYKKQVNELIAEVNSLNVDIAQNNEEYLRNTYELEQKLKLEEASLGQVRQKHQMVANDCEKTMKEWRRQWETEKNELINKKNRQQNEAKEKLQELARKLDNIKLFREHQTQYINQINELTKKIEDSKDIHKDELEKIRQQHIQIRRQIEEDAKKHILNIRQVEHQHATAKLGDREKHTKKQNQILQGHIEMYREEERALQEEADKLQREIKEQQYLLQQVSRGNPSLQNHQRSLKIINLQEKINQLKTFYADETKRLDIELESMSQAYDKKEKDLQKEIKKYRDGSRRKDKQLQDLKAYSQMVLDQRGSIEWFLLEVFSQKPQLTGDKVANMDHILRSLFTKINSGLQPRNWRKKQESEFQSAANNEIIIMEDGQENEEEVKSQSVSLPSVFNKQKT